VKVTTERLPKSLIALDIELDQQQVNKGLERAARKLSQQYSIPGFRPGKAPRFIVENYLGRARIMEEASDDLINKAFQDALKQENINPVGKANLENVEESPFRFRVTVPVEPVVELGDYRAYEIPYELEPVSEETIAKLLDAQREQHVVLQELEEMRPAQEGDMITLTVSSDLEDDDEDEDDDLDEDDDEDEDDDLDEDDDEDEEAGDEEAGEDNDEEAGDEEAGEDNDEEAGDEEGKEEKIALVQDRVRPEIYEALLGSQPGDTRVITVRYDENDENEQLRGREVTYTFTVKNIQERLLPEWDELPTLTDFEGDIEALRANARKRLEHAAEERSRKKVLDAFLERAVAETQVEIPDAMIEERAGEMFHEQVGQFAQYGITEEQYLSITGKSHEDAVTEFREPAEQDVRRSLVVREIIRREELQLQEQDLQEEVARFLADFGPEREAEVMSMLENPRMSTMLASAALDRKLRDRLVAIAKGEVDSAGNETTAADEEPVSDEGTTPAAVAQASDEETDGEKQVAPVE
jgi:trigger factor